MKPPDASEETLFDVARQMPDPQARTAYLDAACAGNPNLRQRIEDLLKAGLQADQFLAGDPLELGAAGRQTIVVGPLSEGPGSVIGNYKLLEKLGEGGFGVVYMAEQKQPVKRRVALKIIKIGMDTREVVARFEAERQALAIMDHPNIAKIFDAGATESTLTPALSHPTGGGAPKAEAGAGFPLPTADAPHPLPSDGRGIKGEGHSPLCTPHSALPAGRPYFVMELVRGVKITDYCDQKNLPTRERLDLFMLVCQAVQHAHQKGIIHRDLKPSNILVTVNDGVAVPKIIDFGIAKATQMELTEKTVFTRFQQFLGTPAYMSPEQAEITSVDVDTRSDIYSLGVLLYELLTGKTPFDAKELLQAGLDEMRHTLREKEPARPSTRVSTLGGDELTTTAKRRGLEPPKLINLLRGDLDWIVMKCLEKDRARRYETANGLATDIERHLNNEPVVACPPSKIYKFQKLVRRNKVAFATGAGIAAALLIGLAIALWQSIEKTRAYNRALAAEQAAVAARARAEANERKAQASEQQAQIQALKSYQVAQFMADMFHGLAPSVALGRDTALLKDILDKAAQRIGTELTNQPEVEIELRASLADAYNELGLFKEEEAMARKCLELAQARFAADSPQMAEALCRMAMALNDLGQPKEGEAAARESVAIRRKLLAARQDGGDSTARDTELRFTDRFDPNNLYHSLEELGKSLYGQDEFEQAETPFREALALARKVRGDEHEDVATLLNDLGLTLWQKDDLSKAEETLREALTISRKLYDTNAHPYFAATLNNLALVHKSQGKLDDAETLNIESLEMTKKMVGPEHRHVAIGLHNLANLARAQNRLADAERLTRAVVAMFKRLGTDEGLLTSDLCGLGEILRDERKFDEARAAVSESLALRRKLLGNDHVDVAYTLLILATVLERQGKLAGAEPQCRECLAIYEAKTPDHYRVFEARGLVGACLLAQRRYADAEPFLLSSYQGLKEREPTAPKVIRPKLKATFEDLVQLYGEMGRPDSAAEWKQKLAEFEKAQGQPKADAP